MANMVGGTKSPGWSISDQLAGDVDLSALLTRPSLLRQEAAFTNRAYLELAWPPNPTFLWEARLASLVRALFHPPNPLAHLDVPFTQASPA